MRRRAVLVLSVALLATVGAAHAATGDSLALVDPTRNAVVANVALGAEPSRIAFGEGAFWIVAPESREVLRVDAATHAVERVTLGEEPYDAAVGGGAVWVPDHDGYVLLRLDPATRAVRSSRKLGSPAISAAYGVGAVWTLLADGRLLRVDPRTLAVTATIRQVAYPREGAQPHLAFDRGVLWVADPVVGQLVRIDPVRRRVVSSTNGAGYGIAFEGGARWLADGTRDLWRLGAGPPARVPIGPLPWDVAAGAGAVWTITRSEGTLVRVDPQRRRVVARIRLAHRAAAVAFGAGLVAVVLPD